MTEGRDEFPFFYFLFLIYYLLIYYLNIIIIDFTLDLELNQNVWWIYDCFHFISAWKCANQHAADFGPRDLIAQETDKYL